MSQTTQSESQKILIDQKAREQALDMRHSYIVQAPAGSGKTSLLIQRFLSALAIVEHNPEECLALTFTRKAAFSMREKILTALKEAASNKEKDPSEITYNLALKVLARDKKENWNLLKNPARLKIQTLDAL